MLWILPVSNIVQHLALKHLSHIMITIVQQLAKIYNIMITNNHVSTAEMKS